MSEQDSKSSYKKFLLFVTGSFVLILGITLILTWFDAVIILFQGAAGIVLALAGLFTLYAISKL